MLKAEKKRSASYPRGVCPAGRRFAMLRQVALLETALAAWPRRQAPLLEVNCGNGAFLEFLWQSGFDVRGTEADAELRKFALRRAVPDLEIYAASDEDLPFENEEFDWVIVHLKTGEEAHIAACANEAVRLARRGLMITFWNSHSLPGLCWRMLHSSKWAENSASWWVVWRQIDKLNLGSASTFSTLAAPVCAWRKQLRLGSRITRSIFGSWCAIRLDLCPQTPVTPLPLRLNAGLRQPEPALEYTADTVNPSEEQYR